MDTIAVLLEEPERIALRRLELRPTDVDDVVVDIEWSGISTGTERLFWSGRMPTFPGMGYPLVPGYESVGRVVAVGANAQSRLGERVFVPGAACYRDAHALFGGAARRVVVPSTRAIEIPERLAERGVLLALAATAEHAIAGGAPPDLIVGHGMLGRLLARLTLASGAPAPTVWEKNPERIGARQPYPVIDPASDDRRDYRSIYDASGDSALLDQLVMRLAKGGEIVLAGFYEAPLSFAFPPAFMREARLRVAAEWRPEDLTRVKSLMRAGLFSLDALITHHADATKAEDAYRTAFGDDQCLKMVLDWRGCA
ncbi:MAG: chlorophyll synthesis pathway protein BchC [Alphaproteobacteria bacterium]|nr:chlorophyll synthesis pathway protein BchC [Alphaproteobacteria bacterium]